MCRTSTNPRELRKPRIAALTCCVSLACRCYGVGAYMALPHLGPDSERAGKLAVDQHLQVALAGADVLAVRMQSRALEQVMGLVEVGEREGYYEKMECAGPYRVFKVEGNIVQTWGQHGRLGMSREAGDDDEARDTPLLHTG